MVMWNWRGRQMIAAIDRKVMVRKRAASPCGSRTRLSSAGVELRLGLADARAEGEHDIDADRQEGEELDAGFEGDGRDHALMVLVGVDMAGAEQDGEDRHADRGQERRVAEDRGRRSGQRAVDVGDRACS